MSIFKNQSLLKIVLETSTDLTAATNLKILYKKPSQKTGSFTGVANGQNIEYTVADGDIDEAGDWQFQAYFEESTRKAYGDKVIVKVEDSIL